MIAVTGSPDTGNGSILLVGGTTGGPYYQDVKLSASLTLDSGADNGGLVFGYRDKDNFWLLIASRVSTRVRLYEVASGTWSLREQSGLSIISGSGGTYTITLEARSGSVCGMEPGTVRAHDSAGPIPAGAVGLWAGSGSGGVQFDDFTVRNLAAFCLVDGRFVDDVGNVRVSGGKLEFYNSDGLTRRTVLEHVRQGKGITQAELTFRNGIDAGIILHYQDPENFLVALLDDNGSGTITPKLVKYADGKKQASLASGSTFSLTDTTAYTVKCTVNDDPGNSALQALNLYVGPSGGSLVLRLTTTAVDDTWSAGKVGLFRAIGVAPICH